ncbi:MAG TPA: hypothetical protein VGQ69_06435, partial [Gemmatimonadales bacterium]|nr:hypothetical protein [Gemmatimonadales bacterium]
MTKGHYRRLLLMALLSFLSMYALMYAMVNAAANIYVNLNQLYMAGLALVPAALGRAAALLQRRGPEVP